VGITTFTWTVTDTHSNVATATQTVTVTDNELPIVTLTSPNGSESWLVGTTHNITWTATDNCGLGTVDLYYSTDGGATYPNTIATGWVTPGAYPWVIPNVVTEHGRVKLVVRDATGNFLEVTSGADFTITGLSAITDLAAQQVRTLNPAGSTTQIRLTWTPTLPGTSVEVWRKGFGHYPEYDDAGGAVPAPPSSSANAMAEGWTKAGTVAAPGATLDDVVGGRDYYYFVAYVKAGVEVSAVSGMTTGTLNYHLGDVSNGEEPLGVGNNHVFWEDISGLGGHYGIALVPGDPYNFLDVGPTSNMYISGRPTTDNKINFEDLVMFAINFDLVSAPDEPLAEDSATPASTTQDELTLEAPEKVGAGMTVTVGLNLRGSGTLHALSTKLTWDAAVVQPVDHQAGEWLTQQNGFAFTPAPGTVDAAVFQPGGMTGEGRLATVTFRTLAGGDPKFAVAATDGRDVRNQKVTVASAVKVQAAVVPLVTELAFARPNPFSQTATLSFSLSQGGPVELVIYSVGGRRVRTLAHEVREPGKYELVWDGRDDGGSAMPAGVYYAHLVTAQGRFHRTVTYLK
jgi:hypothetical protein